VDIAAYVTRTNSRLVEVATRHSQDSTRPGYAVVTHRTADVSPYRTIGTSSSKPCLGATGPGFTSPGRRIHTFLPWRRCVVTKSKLQKVITESKSLLACHLVRLLQSLYGHLSVSSPQFLKIESYMMYYTHNDSDTSCDIPSLNKDGRS
jgi:hypothetical protein